MKKILLFTAALLCATSMWAHYTLNKWVPYGSETMACGKNEYDSVHYSQFIETTTTWPNANVAIYHNDSTFGDTITGSSPAQGKMGVFSMYEARFSTPSYARTRYSWKFKIGSHNKKHHSTVCLYYSQDETTVPISLQYKKVDFSDNHATNAGEKYLLAPPFVNTNQEETAGWYYSGEYTKEFTFDYRYSVHPDPTYCVLMLTHVIESGDKGKDTLQEISCIKTIEDITLVETVYYKIVTFNANGGTGTMDKDTIENSGNLTANTFTKDGYYFMGWATSQNGAVEYFDEATITATAEDKGLDTLYAVWKEPASITSVPTPILGMVYDGEEKTLINAGSANGGTMQYSLDNADWSADLPKATNAGTYTVYYKVVGDASHADYTPENNTVTATIDKAAENYDANRITVLDARQGANTGEDIANKLFDGNRTTKWCSFTNDIPAYSDRPEDMVVWRTEGFVKMVSYTLITGNDTQKYPNRNWSSWTLYGGKFESDNDAKSALLTDDGWTIIDNQINDTVLKAFNDSSFQFACNNPGWYKYYRLVIHEIRKDSTPQDNIQQMAELTMGVLTGTPPAYETRPSAKAYLKHSGDTQPLINAGSATNGATVVYKLENGEWSTEVPQADTVGNYYVYYKIQETESYPESEPDTLITTIYGNKTVPVHDNYPYGGITVLAKQEGSNTDSNQHADRLFNGDADSYDSYNKWCSVTTDIAKYEDRPKDIVVWKTAKAIEMISYELRIGNDAETYHNRNWYSWTIYGGEFDSDNAAKAALTTEEGWTIIDNQINDTVLKEKNLERYNFVCNNPGTYKYYRLVIHALHVTTPATNQSVQQMGELTMGIEHIVPVYQTRPSAKANLQYTTGDPQTLIEAGTPTTGTILYKLEGGEWSTEVPQADTVGNYYVYYKIQIQDSEIAPDTLIATIYGNRTVPEHDDYSYSNISVLAKQEGSDTSDNQRADKLFNGNDQTSSSGKWCSELKGIAKYEDRPKDIVVWKTASDIEMISYQLKTGNDTQQYPNRNWYSWTIYGGTFANDAEATAAMLNEGAWTIIDNQIKDTVLEKSNNAQYDFACNNPGTYQYYRLVIHALHVTDSAKTQGVQQMQELTMGIKKSPATGVEEAKANGKAVKVLRDGQLFIIREGKKYNAQGVLVESRK